MNNPKKLTLIASIFLSIPFLFGCFIDMKRVAEIASDNREQLPIRRLRIVMDPSEREILFEQLQKFADNHNFEIDISDYGTDGETYLVWMLRDNIKILTNHSRSDPTIVSIGFYDQTRANPTSEETLETIDGLIIDIEDFLNEIPDITITEE